MAPARAAPRPDPGLRSAPILSRPRTRAHDGAALLPMLARGDFRRYKNQLLSEAFRRVCRNSMTTEPKKEEAVRLRKFIERLYGEGIVRGESGTLHSISPASITADRGAFVRDICIAEGATRTLEIGMAWGMSTLFILEALLENGAEPGAHLAIDPYESIEYHGAGRRNLKRRGFRRIRRDQGRSIGNPVAATDSAEAAFRLRLH